MMHSLKVMYKSVKVLDTILTVEDFKDEPFTLTYYRWGRQKECTLVYSPAARTIRVTIEESVGGKTTTRSWQNDFPKDGKKCFLKPDVRLSIEPWTIQVRVEDPTNKTA